VRFATKTALVSGAARGIGAAIATRLASEGARVAIGDLDAAAAEKLAAELSSEAQPCLGLHLDVADLDSVRATVDQVCAELGPIDVLVNNAGIDRIQPFLESEPDVWDRLLAVNLRGPSQPATPSHRS